MDKSTKKQRTPLAIHSVIMSSLAQQAILSAQNHTVNFWSITNLHDNFIVNSVLSVIGLQKDNDLRERVFVWGFPRAESSQVLLVGRGLSLMTLSIELSRNELSTPSDFIKVSLYTGLSSLPDAL